MAVIQDLTVSAFTSAPSHLGISNLYVSLYLCFSLTPQGSQLKSKLFYLTFKAFLIWPLPVLQTDYLFKHLYSGHIKYSLFLSTLHFLLHAFAYAHSPSGEIPRPSRLGSNAIFSPQAVSHFILLRIPYPSSPVCYNVFIYVLTPWLLFWVSWGQGP